MLDGASCFLMGTETAEPSLGHAKPHSEGRSQQSSGHSNTHSAGSTSSPTVDMSLTRSPSLSKGEWSLVDNMAIFGDAFSLNNTS